MGVWEKDATDTPRTDGLMRRVDYLRLNARAASRSGLNAPPGDNPYAEDFGVLPDNEIMRLMNKHLTLPPVKLTDKARQTTLTIKAVYRRIGRIDHAKFTAFKRGDGTVLGRTVKRRLSTLMQQIDSGRLRMVDGELELFDEPLVPERPKMVYRLVLEVSAHGPYKGQLAPRIVPDGFVKPPPVMPRLFKDFKTGK